LNGETVFMYVLAAGAAGGKAVPANSWTALQPFYGVTAGRRFVSADLGLFVFQYGLDLLDFRNWHAPGEVDLVKESATAALANYEVCRDASDIFSTYRSFWGLSSGDGPGQRPEMDVYRSYAPSPPLDGTAHVTCSVASIGHCPDLVLENVRRAERETRSPILGRYGFSNVNIDRGWVGRDVVGIDLGAQVLALDNFLSGDRVRTVFHSLPCVRKGLDRFGFVQRHTGAEQLHEAGTAAAYKRAS
jgi:hypothetical protein